jgi:hypothetical protein
MFLSVNYYMRVKILGCWLVVNLQIAEILIILVNINDDSFFNNNEKHSHNHAISVCLRRFKRVWQGYI